MMKYITAIVLILIIITACKTDSGAVEEMMDIVSLPARGIKKPGKIYIKDDFIYVNEKNGGVHIIDNGDPYHPEKILFLQIPGNKDIAIKDQALYADSYKDLLVIDIGAQERASEKMRIENAFPDPPELPLFFKILLFPLMLLALGGQGEPSEPSSSGEGGSMARFTIVSDYLYVLHNNTMSLYEIKDPFAPVFVENIFIGQDIETIFPYQDKLFIGSGSSMYIYDNSNPGKPKKISEIFHATGCDPVVAQGNLAYVTIRSGNNCFAQSDELLIIDLSIIFLPELLCTYPMANPHGLAIADEYLFICDGTEGLKLYNAMDPLNLKLLDKAENIYPTDLIISENVAVVIARQGLFQYSFRESNKLELISKI